MVSRLARGQLRRTPESVDARGSRGTDEAEVFVAEMTTTWTVVMIEQIMQTQFTGERTSVSSYCRGSVCRTRTGCDRCGRLAASRSVQPCWHAPLILNESKPSRPRPNFTPRGRNCGLQIEVEAEIMALRPSLNVL